VPVADIVCALFALYAILCAHIGASKTGQGQHIDASLFDAAIAFAIWDISEYWGTGKIPGPLGTGNRMSAPYQAVRASEGYFVMGANSARLWQSLCEAIARPDLLDDPRFKTIADRLANRIVLIEELEKIFATRPATKWIELLLGVVIPAGPILNYAEALGSEHSRVRESVMEIDHPIEGKVKSIGFSVKLSRTKQKVRRPPPLLGEHSDAILAELGYDEASRRDLRESGAVKG